MSRKLDKKRLHKLIRNIVIFISVFSLMIAAIRSYNYSSLWDWTMKEKDLCELRHGVGEEVCYWYLDSMIENERNTERLFIVGATLPILFFGGTALYNYLFPEKKEKK
jgi:hypothetical protein